eukprot:1152830-Pelagomonas_calceolata.AAC.1
MAISSLSPTLLLRWLLTRLPFKLSYHVQPFGTFLLQLSCPCRQLTTCKSNQTPTVCPVGQEENFLKKIKTTQAVITLLTLSLMHAASWLA